MLNWSVFVDLILTKNMQSDAGDENPKTAMIVERRGAIIDTSN